MAKPTVFQLAELLKGDFIVIRSVSTGSLRFMRLIRSAHGSVMQDQRVWTEEGWVGIHEIDDFVQMPDSPRVRYASDAAA